MLIMDKQILKDFIYKPMGSTPFSEKGLITLSFILDLLSIIQLNDKISIFLLSYGDISKRLLLHNFKIKKTCV